MEILTKSFLMRFFLLLSCVFYFILLCLTAFGINYTVKNSKDSGYPKENMLITANR